MNNVCLAGQVAVLFRRLVHVVSTVSVAQQYHFYQRNRSTVEHTSSQPTVEYQDLPLGQTLLNGGRSSAIPSVLAEQWSRFKGREFWESWRSSLMSVQQPPQHHQPNFGAYLDPILNSSFLNSGGRRIEVFAMVRVNETTFNPLH